MVVIDVSFDHRFILVCDDDLENPRYEQHDGTSLRYDDDFENHLVKHMHISAAQIRDDAMHGMGIIPFQPPSPKVWQRLTNRQPAFPLFSYAVA